MSAPLTGSDGKPLPTGEYEIDGKKVRVVSTVTGGVDTDTPDSGIKGFLAGLLGKGGRDGGFNR